MKSTLRVLSKFKVGRIIIQSFSKVKLEVVVFTGKESVFTGFSCCQSLIDYDKLRIGVAKEI
jgi:hypothetical protein